MPIDMFDTITVASVPSVASTSKDAVAGYVDGRWADYSVLAREFPLDHHVSVAVFARDNADALDVEPGDAVMAEVPGWVRRQHARGLARPIVYVSLSNLQALLDTLAAAGINRKSVRIWMAHYIYNRDAAVAELAQYGVDAVQWTDHYEGRNLDGSVLLDDFFALHLAEVKPLKLAKPKRRVKAPVRRVAVKIKTVAKKAKPHPKVAAGGIAGVLTAALVTYLNSHGVAITHLNSQDQDIIVLASTLLTAWAKGGPSVGA